MSGIKAVIFDLDGTLIDSVPDIAAALNRTLAGAGRPGLAIPEVVRLIGGGARQLVAQALGGETPEPLIDRLHAEFLATYEAEPVVRTRPYAGAREALAELSAQGFKLAICTNKPARLTHIILEALDLASPFAAVWAGEPDKPLKPDPVCLLTVCAALDVPPAAAVMVGDSHADVAAALASGCPSVLVRNGYETRALESLGAGAIVDDLTQLAAALPALSARTKRIALEAPAS